MKNDTNSGAKNDTVTYAGGFEARPLTVFGCPSLVLSRNGSVLTFANRAQARAKLAKFREANPGLDGFARETVRPFLVIVAPPAV